MTSTPELVYVVLALCRIGATADLISPLFSEKQIIDRVNETDADIMFVLDSLYEKISDATDKMCIKKYVIVEVTNGMSGVTKIMASMKLAKHIVYTPQIIKWKNVPAGYKFVKGFPVKNNGKRDMDAIKKDVDDIIWM